MNGLGYHKTSAQQPHEACNVELEGGSCQNCPKWYGVVNPSHGCPVSHNRCRGQATKRYRCAFKICRFSCLIFWKHCHSHVESSQSRHCRLSEGLSKATRLRVRRSCKTVQATTNKAELTATEHIVGQKQLVDVGPEADHEANSGRRYSEGHLVDMCQIICCLPFQIMRTRSAKESSSCPINEDFSLHRATLPSKKSKNRPRGMNAKANHRFVRS